MVLIKRIPVGLLETNCYLAETEEGAILIDPGDDADEILREIGDKKIDYVVLTHLHFDHIGAVSKVKKATNAKVLCGEKDFEILEEALLKKSEINILISDEVAPSLEIGNWKLEILNTPGHTPGSICLYFPEQNILFSGDTIFKGSVGVTHFKGGNHEDLKRSVEEKLFALPDETVVYPGHGSEFVLGEYKNEIKDVLHNY